MESLTVIGTCSFSNSEKVPKILSILTQSVSSISFSARLFLSISKERYSNKLKTFIYNLAGQYLCSTYPSGQQKVSGTAQTQLQILF